MLALLRDERKAAVGSFWSPRDSRMQGRLFMRVVKVVLGIVLVLLLLRGCGALVSGSSESDDHAAGPSATSPVEPAPSTAPATSPTTETAPSTATQAPASPTSAPPHTPRPTPTASRSTVASGSAAQGVLALPVVGVSDGDTIKVLVDGRTEPYASSVSTPPNCPRVAATPSRRRARCSRSCRAGPWC